MTVYRLDRHGAATPAIARDRAVITDGHYHVTYCGKSIGPIVDRRNADRIANNASIKHPDVQVHVKRCDGRCGR